MTTSTLVITPLVTIVMLLAWVQLARMLSGWKIGKLKQVGREEHDRIALEDEKVRLLTAVHDCDYEYELGKLSDEDHRTMRARFEADAVAVIEKLKTL
jgi:hypothetical protein